MFEKLKSMFEGEGLFLTNGPARGEKTLKGTTQDGRQVELRMELYEQPIELGQYDYDKVYRGTVDGVPVSGDDAKALFEELSAQAKDKTQ